MPLCSPIPRQSGLTLLEVLVVVALLTVMAGSAVLVYGGFEKDARRVLAEAELDEVREALLAFRKDNGAFPKTGRFALVPDGGSEPVPAEGASWFRSPFNLVQLFRKPVAADPFDPETGRGWRGPYLRKDAAAFAVASDRYLADGSVGSGTQDLGGLWAVADPFVNGGPSPHWSWASAPGDPEPIALGAPVLVVGLDDPATARIVSFGPDGIYDLAGFDPDDPTTWTQGDDVLRLVLR